MSRAQLEAQLADLQRELKVRQRGQPARSPGVYVPPAISPHFQDTPHTPALLGQAEARKRPLQAHAAQAPGTPTQETEAPSSAVPDAGPQPPKLAKEQQKFLVCAFAYLANEPINSHSGCQQCANQRAETLCRH